MARQDVLTRILHEKIVAVVRFPDPGPLTQVAEALVRGGVTILEVTMTVPNALEVLREVKRLMQGRALLGAGTILDAESARAAILAGADFIVGPTFHRPVIELCHRYDILVMPGAFTPTEILSAWEAGADIVKVFPAEVGGPAFFKALRGPLPQLRLMPTGGVNLQTARAFLDAGACCLGVGSALVDPRLVAAGDFASLCALAQQFVAVTLAS